MTSKQHIIFGLHAVQSALQHQPDRIRRLCVVRGRHDQKMTTLVALAKELGVTIEMVSAQDLDHLTQEANHQGVVAVCQQQRDYSEADLPALLERIEGPPFILVLDGVQDPHNLGACLRSADAAGVHVVIAPRDKAVGITPVVSKVASGAAETIPFVQVTNLARTLEILKELGIWVYGAAGEAEQSLFQANLKGPVAMVLGAEGSGLRRLTRDRCDVLLRIPMSGSVASLNVSVATGVFLFEIVRQRQK